MRRKRGNQSWNRWENNTRGKQEKETKSEVGSEEMKMWGEKNLLHSKRGQTEAQRGQAISPRPPTSGHLVSSQRFFMTPDWGERGAGRGGAGHLHLPGAWMLPQLVAWINDSQDVDCKRSMQHRTDRVEFTFRTLILPQGTHLQLPLEPRLGPEVSLTSMVAPSRQPTICNHPCNFFQRKILLYCQTFSLQAKIRINDWALRNTTFYFCIVSSIILKKKAGRSWSLFFQDI